MGRKADRDAERLRRALERDQAAAEEHRAWLLTPEGRAWEAQRRRERAKAAELIAMIGIVAAAGRR